MSADRWTLGIWCCSVVVDAGGFGAISAMTGSVHMQLFCAQVGLTAAYTISTRPGVAINLNADFSHLLVRRSSDFAPIHRSAGRCGAFTNVTVGPC